MFENNYNSETNTKETEYVPVGDNTVQENNKKKKGSFKKVLKTVGALCCIAAISTGSIIGYRYFSNGEGKDHKSNSLTDKSSSEDQKDSENEKSTTSDRAEGVDYQANSLLQLSKSENALSTQEIYKKVIPSVVGVSSTFQYETPSQQYGGLFGYFYGDDGSQGDGSQGDGSQGGGNIQNATGTGTGIIISEDGYLMTNAHVICDDQYGCAKEVSVLMSDEKEYPAAIVGYDAQTDIAVLKVDAAGLTAAEIGDSSSVQVGDAAIAIGNPLGFDLFGTLTVGYISGIDREIAADDTIMNLIQTDAAINSGNSGGPLINDCGQIIGINSMKLSTTYSSSSASIEGLGFAIPINEAKKIVDDLMTNGHVTGRPQLGITCRNVSSASSQQPQEKGSSPINGVLVNEVTAGGSAEKAGVQANDVIVGADGKAVETVEELNQIKNKFNAGDTLSLTIIRDNKYCKIDVVLEEAAAQ